MKTAKVYSLLVNKAVRKGRSKVEVDEFTRWLTGYSQSQSEEFTEGEGTYVDFFQNAPTLNPARERITGGVCCVRVENVDSLLLVMLGANDLL